MKLREFLGFLLLTTPVDAAGDKLRRMPDRQKMKAAVYVCLALSILVCLAWPFAAFISIFFFDAPFRSTGDMVFRYGLALFFLAYPWGLVVVALSYLKKERVPLESRRTCFYLLAPYLHLLLFVGVLLLLDATSKRG